MKRTHDAGVRYQVFDRYAETTVAWNPKHLLTRVSDPAMTPCPSAQLRRDGITKPSYVSKP